ncbi:hypothetical protein [Winogradskyella undariae]|uniref:hypothetical protein n=1 Tax=Winogradskyella undariae TaxID=1285465 RepID=UPI0015CD7D5D|nr:hypothetical protein [Winogradskyella undariae]
MLNRILNYFEYGNHFCGIEHYSNNGRDILQLCLLKQSKNELNIELAAKVETIEQASKKLSKNQHVVLIINTDKVLSKTIESEQNDALKIVYKAFPNINLDDFYFEVLTENNTHFISLCRIDYIEPILKKYTEQNIHIIDISFGNTIISSVKSFIDSSTIHTSNAITIIKDSYIVQIKKHEVEHNIYNINGLTLPNDQILSFSAALQSVLNNSVTKTNFAEKKTSLTKNFKHVHFFSQFLKFGGLFVLVLLLANFFFFNHYFNKVNDLKQVSKINQSTKAQILKLDEIVSKKQKKVDDLLKSNGSKSSFYSDRIMQSLPQSILLSEFNYQPLLKRIKADKTIELEQNSISVSGVSSDSDAFSNWIALLEQDYWIDKVEIIDYGTTSSYLSDFSIKIVLINE